MHEKTFTVVEARAALARLRELLAVLREERAALGRLHGAIQKARAKAEQNGGSPYGELYLTHAFEFATTLDEVEQTGAIIKDFTADAFDPGTASQSQFSRDSDLCADQANVPRNYQEAGAYGTHAERHEIYNSAFTAFMVAHGYRQRGLQFAAPYDVRL